MASEDLLKKAVAAFNALSPEQQAEMLEEQRQSWVRGNVGLSRDERGMTTPVAPVSSEPFEDNTLELARRILGADTGLTINPLPRCEGPQNVRPRYAIWGDDLEALAKAALKSVAPVSPDATGKCGELVANVWALVKPDGNLVEVTRYASMANLWRERGYHPAEYVTRSQAVELLAAERAEKKELDAECRVLAKRCIEKDARVKELEDERYKLAYAITGGEDAPGYLDSLSAETLVEVARKNTQHWFAETDRADKAETKLAACEKQLSKDRKLRNEAQCDADLWRFSVDMGDHPSLLVKVWKQRKALEAKLTAAEKARERLTEFANSFHVTVVDNFYNDVTMHLDMPHSLSIRIPNDSSKSFIFKDLEERRRAALGGKPS